MTELNKGTVDEFIIQLRDNAVLTWLSWATLMKANELETNFCLWIGIYI